MSAVEVALYSYASPGNTKPLAGLYVDIQNITCKASRLVLELLLGDEPSVLLPKTRPAHANMLFVGNVADQPLFVESFQAFWATTEGEDSCPCTSC